MEHLYSQDWFTHNTTNFTDCTTRLREEFGKVTSILEIGCYEGRGTCWMLENMLSDTGTIICIDPFMGVDNGQADPTVRDSVLESRFNHNVNLSKKSTQTVSVIPTVSYTSLATLISSGAQFDFIYVDGSHSADEVLADAVMAFGLLKKNGYMIFDDYLWKAAPDSLDRPKMSIDAFVNMFQKHIEVKLINYQYVIQKV
jgi:predicted O-methyltransferase YrrM